jgi:phospholipid/cholesterol/gamma-HCH transport system ATP-binding protein
MVLPVENGAPVRKRFCAFVLAGGKSLRMGTDKSLILLGGRTLVEHAIDKASAVAERVVILGSREKYGAFGSTVEDIHPGCGPLCGIEAGLKSSDSDLNLFLAVDTPFVPIALLRYLLERAEPSGALVTVPVIDGKYEPLCAVYRREFLASAERAIASGEYAIAPLFEPATTRVVDEEELGRHGFGREDFANLNTVEELERARVRSHGRKHVTAGSHEPKDEMRKVVAEIGRQTGDEHIEQVEREPGPYIEFKHVSKAFGEHTVLDDVSFEVQTAQTLCIVGRSGVGKSVALHHIMGFLKPDSGRIIVAHEDITDYPEQELERIRKKVTMVFQNGALFDSLTVGENVAFPLRERHHLDETQIYQIVDGLLDMVGVKPMRDQLPSDLSTGMKRSVAIARALAAEPDCILYDEPTTMVDPLMAQLLGNLIQKLKQQLKLTSIVVTHDMKLAKKLADCVLFLHEAKVAFFGTFAEMEKSDVPIVREFLKLDEMTLGEFLLPTPGGSETQSPAG